MNSIPTLTQTTQISASAEVERRLIDYLMNQLQKSNNLPAAQDGAQWAQLHTRLDVCENRLKNVQDTVRVIQGEVKSLRHDVASIRSDVSNIQQGMIRIQGNITGMRKDIRVIEDNICRRVDSLCDKILNVRNPRLKKSRLDQAKFNIKSRTS
ncbi:hypothetical protein E4U13_007316 [Claviceps humidiphila]|uniref:Uncharacterized protein n=1 Tax=Claviceps humidiphila TaxID=1294629 RepID=A0A9P7PYE5_9HYPO|nr:hypothetical protein E4U13_007316 [Claviceps humidiphila]